MADIWRQFRASPSAFITSHRTNVNDITQELLEILSSEDKNDSLKLNVLEILQECCNFLFDNTARLESALNSLRSTFESTRYTGDQVVSSQVLVSITVILIGSDYINNLQQFLVEFVSLLLDIVLKIKTESSRIIRAVACECLKELELTIPGLLCDVVGSFYGLSVSENSFIHQHYMALFATVLSHCVQKLALEFNDTICPLSDDNRSLEDLLFFSGNITFEPQQKYLKTAQQIIAMAPGELTIPVERDQSVLKKAVTHLVDHMHLFTSSYKVLVIQQLIKTIKHSSLAPVMLKSLLLHYVSSSDIQLFNIVLLMKLYFEEGICDSRDEETLLNRLLIASVHPCLRRESSSLVMQWLIEFHRYPSTDNTSNEPIPGNSFLDSSILLLNIFDTPEMCWYKLQALLAVRDTSLGHSYLQGYIAAVQKPVLYGIVGPLSQLFYRTIVMCAGYEELREEVERAIADVLIAHPNLTQHTIDMLEAVERSTGNRSLTRTVVSQMCQWLQSLDIVALSSHLSQHLLLLEAAARDNIIKQSIPLSILQRIVCNSDVCSTGLWTHGNALLKVCYSLMQSRPDASISKSLVNLLVEIAKKYDEIDIRDRAQFYSQILLCVSSEKLQLLLCSNGEKSSDADLSQVVVSRISDNVYPLPTPIKMVDSAVLVLSRTPFNQMCNHVFSMSNSQDNVLLAYLSWLKTNDSLGLDIPCNISISTDWLGNGSKIYSVVLQVTTKGKCRNPNDIQIPALSSNGEVVSKNVLLYPTAPYPLTFNINATFTLEDSSTCVSELDPLHVAFEDFFHVVPVDCEKPVLDELFTELWRKIASDQYSCTKPDGRGALSVCCVQVTRATILQMIATKLTKFCVDYTCNSDYNGHDGSAISGLYCLYDQLIVHYDSYKVFIFLPPSCHLLMKLLIQEELTVFEIATDLWSTLPFINDWINTLY